VKEKILSVDITTYFIASDTRFSSKKIEDPEMIEILQSWKTEGYNEVKVDFSGGGDSGYIEEVFTNGQEIPEKIGDWMYDQLENYYSGWEINEGSSGRFTLDFKDIVINLSHSYNTEEGASQTLWEEGFGDS
jgi:hypothetical protein